ncbi:MAG TPA: CHAP domain-containing protein [Longimicrobium sp.]|nr:CHAP domain-containing protein [Longimicrobium sp.]
MRNVLLPLSGLMLIGCTTTGVPVASRWEVETAKVRAFTPAAMPRAPLEDDGPNEPLPPSALLGDRQTAVQLARGLVGKHKPTLRGKALGADCTGLVLGVYREMGLDLLKSAKPGDNGVTAIYRFARKHGRVYTDGWPVAGDLVFFKETYDQNRDGRQNDGLTHVGLVEDVTDDGTVTVIHRVSRGVVRYRMNLRHPDQRVDAKTGRVLNDALRAPGGDRAGATTGQLFAAYATLLPPSPVARR